MRFRDRRHAGALLAEALGEYPELRGAAVLGLPRGGIPVAFEIAVRWGLDLDPFAVRKVSAPDQPELALGAVASGDIIAINDNLVREMKVRDEELAALIQRARNSLQEAESAYRSRYPAVQVEGRSVILVDDGLATGASMRAALYAVRNRAERVAVAVPVGAFESCAKLETEADLLIALTRPKGLGSVGQFYEDFEQVTIEEVLSLLARAKALPLTTSDKDF